MTTITNLPHYVLNDEELFVRSVSAWLASQTMPANDIVWYPNSETMIGVDNVGSLHKLVSDLPRGQYAGLRRNGSSGPWAQVKSIEDQGDQLSGWPFELHPHNCGTG